MSIKDVISRRVLGAEDRDPSRREFLRSAFAGAVAASLSGTAIAGEAATQAGSSQW